MDIEIPNMVTQSIKVYATLDASNNITALNSSIFLQDTTGWTQIDEGNGDRYAHAQGNYFSDGFCSQEGICKYKYVDGEVVEKTVEEIESEIASLSPMPMPDIDKLKLRQDATEDAVLFLMMNGGIF